MTLYHICHCEQRFTEERFQQVISNRGCLYCGRGTDQFFEKEIEEQPTPRNIATGKGLKK